MNARKESQLIAAKNLAERLLTQAEKANQQLVGTIAVNTLFLAAVAYRAGGKYEITADEINAVAGKEIRMEKNEDRQTVIIHFGDSVNAQPQIDETYVPDKLCPFIMDDGTPMQQDPPKIQTTDL